MTTTTAFVTYKRLNLAYRIGGGVVWVLALVALGFYNKETSPALLGLLWAIWGVCSISLIVSLFFSFKSFKQYIENLETEKNALTEKAEQLQALEEETRQTFEQIQQELEAKQQALEIDAQLLQEKTEQINAMEEETRQTFEQIQIAQEILEQSEQALRGRMEAINRTMCVCEFNLDGIIVEANSMMLQILKYTHEELVGKHFKHFIDRNFMESALYELILISLENKIGYSGDIKIVGKESELWFHVTLTPVFSKTKMLERVVLLGNDITINKLKNIEYEARVKSLLQFSPVAEFDLEGNFLRANPLFLAIFDYAKDGMKGKTYLDLVTEDRKETMRELWKNLQTGEFIEGEFLHTNAHGNPIWLRNSYTPIRDLDERPYKIVWLATTLPPARTTKYRYKTKTKTLWRA
jgi:PAS domain S-box-containing protein